MVGNASTLFEGNPKQNPRTRLFFHWRSKKSPERVHKYSYSSVPADVIYQLLLWEAESECHVSPVDPAHLWRRKSEAGSQRVVTGNLRHCFGASVSWPHSDWCCPSSPQLRQRGAHWLSPTLRPLTRLMKQKSWLRSEPPLPTLTEQETETEQRLSSREDRDRSWQRGERKERGGDGWGRLDSGETKQRRWDGCGRGGGSCSDVGQPYANRSTAPNKSGGLAASAEEWAAFESRGGENTQERELQTTAGRSQRVRRVWERAIECKESERTQEKARDAFQAAIESNFLQQVGDKDVIWAERSAPCFGWGWKPTVMVREIHNTYNVSLILSLYKQIQILYLMQTNVVASADNVAFRSSRNDHIYELRALEH